MMSFFWTHWEAEVMWTLYEKVNGEWVLVYTGPTGDRCKSVALNMNRSECSMNLGKQFLIRNPVGNNWMKSADTDSWRMKWVYAESGEQA